MFSAAKTAAASSGFFVNNSVRFRSSASAYLNRTPASAGNQKTWTYSLWLKRGALSTVQNLLIVGSNVTGQQSTQFGLNNDNTIQFFDGLAGISTSIIFDTTQVFRDPSAWYHIILAVDTTQATSTNRVKIYVNGNQITAFTSSTYPTQNFNTLVNAASAHYIGRFSTVSTNYFDGYLSEVYMIDGQQLTPSSFGSTNASTGVWQPARYTGTYGTNGFYLKFSDIATTSGSNAGLGKDFSGNSNYWNTNNISVTAGTTYDAMLDVPTNTSATVANYPVLNPLDKAALLTTADANLSVSGSFTNLDKNIRTTIQLPSTGKWYFEVVRTAGNDEHVGISTNTNALDGLGSSSIFYNESGAIYVNGSSVQTGLATIAINDVVAVAADMDSGLLYFYKNNTLVNSGGRSFTVSGNNWFFTVGTYNISGVSSVLKCTFGQRPFQYSAPSGFLPLNTFNLP